MTEPPRSFWLPEIKNPKKNMPRALILSVLLITAFYTIFSTAMAGLLPINQLAASSAPVADAVSTIPGIGKAVGSRCCPPPWS